MLDMLNNCCVLIKTTSILRRISFESKLENDATRNTTFREIKKNSHNMTYALEPATATKTYVWGWGKG